MPDLERFIRTKSYEWQRKQLRTQEKKQRYQGMSAQRLPVRKPQVTGFRVGGVEQNISQQHRMTRRRRREETEQIKRLIGLICLAIGMFLLLTQCYGGKEKDEEALNEGSRQVIEVTQEIVLQEDIIT